VQREHGESLWGIMLTPFHASQIPRKKDVRNFKLSGNNKTVQEMYNKRTNRGKGRETAKGNERSNEQPPKQTGKET